jgi:hypothetical protein
MVKAMSKSLIEYWDRQGMSYDDSDLPSHMELTQMAIAIKELLSKPSRTPVGKE